MISLALAVSSTLCVNFKRLCFLVGLLTCDQLQLMNDQLQLLDNARDVNTTGLVAITANCELVVEKHGHFPGQSTVGDEA